MEIVSILRILRRHRIAVAFGVPLAVLLGLSMVFQLSLFPPHLGSRQTVSSASTQRVLISAPDLPNVALDSDSHHTLPTRTLLLANYLATDVADEQVARDAGIPSRELTVDVPAMSKPPLEIALAVQATDVATAPTGPYLLTAAADGKVPIITLTGSAPTAAVANKIAQAAIAGLRRTIDAKSGAGPALLVQPLGQPVAKPIFAGPKKVMGAGGAFMFFIFWCSGIVLVGAALRRRETRRQQQRWQPAAGAA
jgi:hypothetical protein